MRALCWTGILKLSSGLFRLNCEISSEGGVKRDCDIRSLEPNIAHFVTKIFILAACSEERFSHLSRKENISINAATSSMNYSYH